MTHRHLYEKQARLGILKALSRVLGTGNRLNPRLQKTVARSMPVARPVIPKGMMEKAVALAGRKPDLNPRLQEIVARGIPVGDTLREMQRRRLQLPPSLFYGRQPRAVSQALGDRRLIPAVGDRRLSALREAVTGLQDMPKSQRVEVLRALRKDSGPLPRFAKRVTDAEFSLGGKPTAAIRAIDPRPAPISGPGPVSSSGPGVLRVLDRLGVGATLAGGSAAGWHLTPATDKG